MRLQAPRKVGVKLQSTPEDAYVTRDEFGLRDGHIMSKRESAVDERNDGLIKEEEELDENLAESNDERKDVEPVDETTASNLRSGVDKVDEQVKSTGLTTVRSLVNGGLAILALGAFSPIGLFLKHLDGLNDEKDNEADHRGSERKERTEDDNDL